jgi:hypothetical protein
VPGRTGSRWGAGGRAVAGWDRWVVPVLPAGCGELCVAPTFTDWDSDGGYADALAVREEFAYALPDGIDDEHAAPLLCAGIIAYRALRAVNVPPGGVLGIYGFGGSAHLAAQVALAEGMRVHMRTRDDGNHRLARELGVDSAGAPDDKLPEPLDGAVTFAPAGDLVPVALARARPRRNAGRRGDLPVRHPGTVLCRHPVPGAEAPQRHGQHPHRRRGVSSSRRPARDHRHHRPVRHRRCRPGAGRPRARPVQRRRGPAR